ncbi:hypothetical protein X943_000593 [Babesia divergens]|uniref:Replication factor C subunit 1 n=1 Tax=Babesia divergens TaxID=32595 RepID=A0AAD9LEJ6_BABDI|nr:hypothetical protein X943_000593 [Babesia divergens]
MDIRTFFGGKKREKAVVSEATAPAAPLQTKPVPELKNTISRSIDEHEADVPLPKVVDKRESTSTQPVDIDTPALEKISKRRRLKKVVDSDNDSDETEPTKSTCESKSEHQNAGKMRTFLKEHLDREPAVDDRATKSGDLQLDIDYYTTNEKRLVNPIVNVAAKTRQTIDFDSYLSSVAVAPSTTKRSTEGKIGSVSPTKDTAAMKPVVRYETPAVTNPADMSTAVTIQSEAGTHGPADAEATANVPDLFSDNEPLPSSPERSPVKSGGEAAPVIDPVSDSTVSGMRFVFTGELLAIDRETVTQLVRDLGGVPVSAISGKTNYLVCGDKLDDGRPYTSGTKYKKAQELNKQQRADIRILNEEEFLKLIDYENVKSRLYKDIAPPKPQPTTVSSGSPVENAVRNIALPFCEKYRPSSLNDVAGNEGNVRKVVEWLRNWTPGSGPVCALLSGPPGVGKTTTAKLVAAECGYECVEFNASDLRNKSAVEKISMLATGGQSFSFLGTCEVKRTLVLLDEVDGMGGGDRGGLQAVVALLPRAACPIICICNDRHNQKLTTLGNKSLDVRFSAPTLAQFTNRVMRICASEGISLKPETIAQHYEQSGGDFRHVLNAIEFNAVSGPDGTQVSARSDTKDIGQTKNLFEATGKMFTLRTPEGEQRFRDLEQIFFIDYNIMPLMVQENYLKYLDNQRRTLPIMQKLAKTFVQADIVEENLKRRQAYSLLPDLAVLSCITPAVEIIRAKGSCRERLMFPQFLGRFSTTSKNRRFLSEIGKHLGPRSLVRSSALVTDGYLNLVYTKIMGELIKGDIEATAQMVEACGMNRELVVDALSSLRLKSQENLYEKVETRKKTALTKRLNEQSVKLAPVKRKKLDVDRIVDEDAEQSTGSDSESSASESELLKKNQKPIKKRQTAKAGTRGGKK